MLALPNSYFSPSPWQQPEQDFVFSFSWLNLVPCNEHSSFSGVSLKVIVTYSFKGLLPRRQRRHQAQKTTPRPMPSSCLGKVCSLLGAGHYSDRVFTMAVFFRSHSCELLRGRTDAAGKNSCSQSRALKTISKKKKKKKSSSSFPPYISHY